MTVSTKRKSGKLLLLILLSAVAAFILVACGVENLTEKDVIKMGYDVAVVYDYQGGNLNDNPTSRIRVKKGSYIPEPGSENASNFKQPVRTNYSFKAFYLAKTDENGALVRDEAGGLVAEREWNFATDKATEDITIFAGWWKNYTVNMHYTDPDNHAENEEAKPYNVKKEIYLTRARDGSPDRTYSSYFNIGKDYTLIDYYFDKAETQKLEFDTRFSYQFESSDFNADGEMDIWAKTLKGSYSVLRHKTDLKSISGSAGVYLYGDIDAEGSVISLPSNFNGNFIGNGHTISNAKVSQSPSSSKDINFGLFRNVGATAVVSDVTFSNLTLEYNLSNKVAVDYNIGVIAGSVEKGAVFKNVKVEGCTLSYKVSVGVDTDTCHVNIPFGHTPANYTGNDNSEAKNVSISGEEKLLTESKDYAVYVKYFKTADGEKTYGDVVGFGSVSKGRITNITLDGEPEKQSDGVYILTVKKDGKKYKITVTGAPVASVAVEETA